jgi:hypothetical protein
MTRQATATISKYIADKMTARVKALSGMAQYDLNYGPAMECPGCSLRHSDCECEPDYKWPGFERACAELRAFFAEIGTLYYTEETDDLSDKEPEAYDYRTHGDDGSVYGDHYEPDPYVELTPKAIARVVLGRDLAEYV